MENQQQPNTIRTLLPDVQELCGLITRSTTIATQDEFWRSTLGRYAAACGGWEVWWPSRESFKSPDGRDVFRLSVEAGYRGTAYAGPLRGLMGMRLAHTYDAAVPAPTSEYGLPQALAWFADVVAKSFWEMRTKIREAEDKCVYEEAKAIQGMSPDGVPWNNGLMRQAKMSDLQMQQAQMQASQLQAGSMTFGNNALQNQLIDKLYGSGQVGVGVVRPGNYLYGKNSEFAYSPGELTYGPWQDKIRREMEAARRAMIRAQEEQARRAYQEMTGDWPGEKTQKEIFKAEAIREALEAMRAAGMIQGSGPVNSPMRGKPAPPEDKPDLTKPAKRKILAIED